MKVVFSINYTTLQRSEWLKYDMDLLVYGFYWFYRIDHLCSIVIIRTVKEGRARGLAQTKTKKRPHSN